jgi:DNA helicase II / ATP-dependent DNA helicase PcrA
VDLSELLDGLNASQRAAVAAPPGHYLVLAGAGSGKTSVLTRRIAYLCTAESVWPHAILAVTFTNKAAAEMRARVESLLVTPHRGMWIGTFHGLANKLLRLHPKECELAPGFQILDSDDQLRMFKRVHADMKLDSEQFPPKNSLWLINAWKDEGLRPHAIQLGRHPQEPVMLDIYRAYQAACQRANAVDFAELLLRCQEMLLNHPALLAHYRQRFTHVLVDEFQDTNAVQYAWVKLLAGDAGQAFIVGDDDQSIYSWRGARVENMQRFLADFRQSLYPEVSTIRLEQNYRSTKNILSAANAVIANNQARMGKALWSDGSEGRLITLFAAHDEQEEARFVIERIAANMDAGAKLSEHAILYRSNMQSRVMEEALMAKGLAYRVYGGLRFFERAEIKDALAYLRLLVNPNDDVSFERAIATPSRGVGEKTLDTLREAAKAASLSLWQLVNQELAQAAREDSASSAGSVRIVGKARNGLKSFIDTLIELTEQAQTLELAALIEKLLEKSRLLAHYQREEKAEEGRAENLQELVSVARRFEPPALDQDADNPEKLTPLQSFLAYAALEAGEHQSKPWEDAVQLMTLHAAKGLEFHSVFVSGFEEGLFPTQRAIDDGSVALEEERRLAYVGITRARQQLTLSYAESRRRYGQMQFQRASRFISEIPSELLEELRPKRRPSGVQASSSASASGQFKLGGAVRHPLFGDGILISAEGHGAYLRVEVRFAEAGVKWLQLATSGLRAI